MSAVNTLNFNGLPVVVQTEVAKCLPLQDLVNGSSVSKLFKRVVENNQAWSTIASQKFLPMKTNIKNHLREEQATIIQEANNLLISRKKMFTEEETKTLLSLKDPFEQREKIIEFFSKKSADQRSCANLVISKLLLNTIKTLRPVKNEIEAVKTLLKGGVDIYAIVTEADIARQYVVIAGNLDEGIFKAYIEGKKKHCSGDNLFEKEIDLALVKKSPALLKLLLKENQGLSIPQIAKLLSTSLFMNNSEYDEEAMWKVIVEGYQGNPNFQKALIDTRNHFSEEMTRPQENWNEYFGDMQASIIKHLEFLLNSK